MSDKYSGLFDDENEESVEEQPIIVEEAEEADAGFTLDEEICLAVAHVDFEKAKMYKQKTGKPVIEGEKPTKAFLKWIEEESVDTSATKIFNHVDEHEAPGKEIDLLTPEDIKNKIKKYKSQPKKSKSTKKTEKKTEKPKTKKKKTALLFDEEPVVNKDDMEADKKNKVYVESEPETKAKKPKVPDLVDTETKPKPKKKLARQKNILFDMKTYPIIILLWGYDGTSKSEQIMKFVDDKGRYPLIFDFENKLRATAQKLGFPQENIITSGVYNEKYHIDGPNTLREFRIILDELRERLQKDPDDRNFAAIALDGVSDIRPFAKDEWLAEHKGRQKPVNPGDWAEINDKVRDIVFTMINIGRAENIHIFLTAQVGGKWKDGEKIEDAPDCKSWIWHNVDHKFLMSIDKENRKFYAFCEKSFFDPFWNLDITDWTHRDKPSLMNILQNPDLVEKYKKEYFELEKQRIKEQRRTNDLI